MDKKQPTISVYLRVSKEEQDEASQRQMVGAWLTAQGIDQSIVVWTIDVVSGTKVRWQQRKLAGILERCTPGDKIIVSELSRIDRKALSIHLFIAAAMEKQIEVIDIRTGMRIDGSTLSKVMVAIIAAFAEMEADNTSTRSRAALKARKDKGLPVGRQPGAKGKKNKLDGRWQEIEKLLEAKVQKTAIARVLGVSRQTLHVFLESKYAEKVAKAQQQTLI